MKTILTTFSAVLAVGCQTTEAAREEVLSHPWSQALRRAFDQGTASISIDVAGEPVAAEIRYYSLRRPGARPLFVLLHGDPGCAAVMARLAIGKAAADTGAANGQELAGLAAFGDILILDCPGYADSRTSRPITDPGEAAIIVAAAIRHFYATLPPGTGTPRVYLCGHSWGGEVAWHLAASRQLDLQRLVLINATGLMRLEGEVQPSELAFASGFWGGFLGTMFGVRESDARKGLRELFHDPELIDDGQVRLYRALTNATYSASRQITIRDITRSSNAAALATLARVAVPTLLLWGADDRAWTWKTQGSTMQQAIPSVDASIIPACGHLPTEEAPDEAARRIIEWVKAQ